MKSLFAFALLFISSVSNAAPMLDLMQSSPSVKWHSIANESVEVIYPDVFGAESVYIANLIQHYAKFVGQTYGIKAPKKFELIIRPEMALPNGFVTLAPRRSEWFTSSTFSPFVGSAEWYQALSIHEYRHVNQFDYFNRNGTKLLYYIMGDFGEELAAFFALPSWYFEGDAVWTETKFTDGGRGRSPRFMARLKALVLSDKIPTYDQFLNGSYQTDLPNQYVYGYALISYGTQKYGEDLWQQVIANVAQFPIPLRLYRSFHLVTGQKFEDFYNDAMDDLRKRWSEDAPLSGEKPVDYREAVAPFKVGDALYYIYSDLDSYQTIVREKNGQVSKVRELVFSSELMGLHVGKSKAVYTEFLPDRRYLFKDYSDLVVLDLATGMMKRITSHERLYNPNLNEQENKIIATEFKEDQTWVISEFDLSGKRLNSFALPDCKVAEVRYMDEQSAVALISNKIGQKSIVVVDLLEKKITKTLVAPSRNILNSLYVDKNTNLLFEAQYKGHNEIFKIASEGVTRCTSTKLGAFTPSSDGTNLYFSSMDTYGSTIQTAALSACEKFDSTQLVDFKYLGDSPSDNYNSFPLQAFPEHESLFTKNTNSYEPKPYGDFDQRLLIPHTWGLDLGRGATLGVHTDNYLHTLSLGAQLGSTAEERQSFAKLQFDVNKYYPVFSFQLEQRNREVSAYNTDDKTKWTEKTAGVTMAVPYIKKSGLYNFMATAILAAAYTDASKYEFNDTEIDGHNYYYMTSGGLGLVWAKDSKARSIMNPWWLSYDIRYDDAKQPSDSAASGFRTFQEAILQTPGAFANDGFRFLFDQQKQEGGYRFLPVNDSAVGYVFSRGYSFQDVPGYQKLSANYTFPMAYPDFNAAGWYYLKRLYSNVFFDSTYVQDAVVDPTLNSYGLEVLLESTILRFLPITIGGRVSHRLLDDETRFDAFVVTGIQY